MTVAEALGIEVAPDAPGGQPLMPVLSNRPVAVGKSQAIRNREARHHVLDIERTDEDE